MRSFEASAAMVLSDKTGVVDHDEVCVEGVNNYFFWEFGFLVFGFACSGPFSFSARQNHHRIHKTVPWVVTHHQPQPWARRRRYRFGRISGWMTLTGGGG
mmetsp:Transcript_26895/g.27275  ORF Transcript_26895/g.27275 Transcript_26895/m.27275 type:complete len:100 (-) Transcript_26895:15-314(-)